MCVILPINLIVPVSLVGNECHNCHSTLLTMHINSDVCHTLYSLTPGNDWLWAMTIIMVEKLTSFGEVDMLFNNYLI